MGVFSKLDSSKYLVVPVDSVPHTHSLCLLRQLLLPPWWDAPQFASGLRQQPHGVVCLSHPMLCIGERVCGWKAVMNLMGAVTSHCIFNYSVSKCWTCLRCALCGVACRQALHQQCWWNHTWCILSYPALAQGWHLVNSWLSIAQRQTKD